MRWHCPERTLPWYDTALQTQNSKLKPWRSEAEHATSRSWRLPTILSFTSAWGRNIFVSVKSPRPGNKPRTLAWKAALLTTTLGHPPNNMCKSSLVEYAWRYSQGYPAKPGYSHCVEPGGSGLHLSTARCVKQTLTPPSDKTERGVGSIQLARSGDHRRTIPLKQWRSVCQSLGMWSG